ncbi:exo-beta-N-acetylmuramidase NamZ family protein [Actinoplanes subglobosus]|uniref:Exo-beta-N-acetylmuramidase NamZ domain-containing protein n=1 Tax=Actinoplanes subglobosus TaxID=1547892 RepID=A0ABV8IW01_9ACTN
MRRNLLAVTGGVLTGMATAPSAVTAAPVAKPIRKHVRTGMDRLAASKWDALDGERVAVVSNLTAVDREYRHLVDRMHADKVRIAGIIGPEHGFRGSAPVGGNEGMGTDPRTGLRVYDGYLATLDRWKSMFTESGATTVVFDIQDVGARFYTYIWTLYDSMAAAAELNLRYLVLDRPNPIGGSASGPMLTPAWASGVGKKEIVQRHGMTVGELARFYQGEWLPKVRLEVIACEGWNGGLFAADTDVPWVMPSPNMPTPDTALVYPGTCLFEGVASLSEGRGTTRPFELSGAPDLDFHWQERLAALDLPGAEFREAYFLPRVGKFVDQLCVGVELRVSDPGVFDPIAAATAMLIEAKRYPGFAWRKDPDTRPFFVDKLAGTDRFRTMIDAGASVADVTGSWQDDLAAFLRKRRPYLLYSRP